jgi:hypothetical protein
MSTPFKKCPIRVLDRKTKRLRLCRNKVRDDLANIHSYCNMHYCIYNDIWAECLDGKKNIFTSKCDCNKSSSHNQDVMYNVDTDDTESSENSSFDSSRSVTCESESYSSRSQDYGTCCYCYEDCNPHSQICGSCSRGGWRQYA